MDHQLTIMRGWDYTVLAIDHCLLNLFFGRLADQRQSERELGGNTGRSLVHSTSYPSRYLVYAVSKLVLNG